MLAILEPFLSGARRQTCLRTKFHCSEHYKQNTSTENKFSSNGVTRYKLIIPKLLCYVLKQISLIRNTILGRFWYNVKQLHQPASISSVYLAALNCLSWCILKAPLSRRPCKGLSKLFTSGTNTLLLSAQILLDEDAWWQHETPAFPPFGSSFSASSLAMTSSHSAPGQTPGLPLENLLALFPLSWWAFFLSSHLDTIWSMSQANHPLRYCMWCGELLGWFS